MSTLNSATPIPITERCGWVPVVDIKEVHCLRPAWPRLFENNSFGRVSGFTAPKP